MKKGVLIFCILFVTVSVIFTETVIFSKDKSKNDTYDLTSEFYGNGTPSSPYLISEANDFRNIAKLVNNGINLSGVYFELTKDIAIESENWMPIGDYSKGYSFCGQIDGKGHNININCKSNENAALIEYCDGTIKNLSISGRIVAAKRAASFANFGHGTIVNCISNAEIVSTNENGSSGGIVNYWDGKIAECVFNGVLSGSNTFAIANRLLAENISGYLYNSKAYKNFPGEALTEYNNPVDDLNSSLERGFLEARYRNMMKWEWKDNVPVLSSAYIGFEGEGTYDYPFIIKNENDFILLSKYTKIGLDFKKEYFIQVSDIEISDNNWSAISKIELGAPPYAGVYNGLGHSIVFSNDQENPVLFDGFDGTLLNVNICADNKNNGLFNYVGGACRCINIKLENCHDENNLIKDTIKNGQVKSVYLKGISEPTIDELNSSLSKYLYSEGLHCDDLYLWEESIDGDYVFGDNYKDTYLSSMISIQVGKGTEANPFLVRNIDDLIYLRESVLFENYYIFQNVRQECDIDLSDASEYWLPIQSFSGIYDGNGHTISNFDATKGTKKVKSFFGYNGGTIENINLEIISSENSDISLLVNINDGNVINSTVINKDLGAKMGIVYENNGLIDNCYLYSEDLLSTATLAISNTGEVNNSFIYDLKEDNEFDLNELNKRVVYAAFNSKRGITTLNEWTLEDNIARPTEKIKRFSKTWIEFYKYVAAHSLICWCACGLLAGLIILYMLRLIKKEQLFSTRENGLTSFISMGAILIISALFFLCLNVINDSMSYSIPLKFFVWISLVIGLLFITVSLIYYRKSISIVEFLKNNYVLLASLIVTFIVGFSFRDDTPIYDADLYYGDLIYGINNFDGTILGFFSAFISWSKIMYLPEMILVIGMAVFSNDYVGVHVINIILVCISECCIYYAVGHIFSNLSNRVRGLMALVFGLLPYVLSGSIYINPDFYSLMLFTYLFAAMQANNSLLIAIFSFSLIGVKPNLAIVYLVLLIVTSYHLANKNIKDVLFTYPLFSRVIGVIAFLLVYVFVAPYNAHTVGDATTGGLSIDGITINTATVISRFLQFFVYGFIWIIIPLLVYILIKNKDNYTIKNNKYLMAACLSSLSLFVTLVLLDKISLCPRYISIHMLCVILIFSLAISLIISEKKQLIVCIAMVFVFGLQNYIEFDPAIKYLTTKDVLSNNLLVSKGADNSFMGDLAFYTCAGMGMAKELERVFATGDDGVITIDMEGASINTYTLGVKNSLIYPVYWNTVKNKKNYGWTNDCIRINAFNVNSRTLREKYLFQDCGNIIIVAEEPDKTALKNFLLDKDFSVETVTQCDKYQIEFLKKEATY